MELEFEWDREKERRNIEKHGVSFHEATGVFADPLSWTVPDPAHSVGERRFITIGMSRESIILVVAHTDRGNKTRLISARKATRLEKRYYEEKT